MCEFWIFYSWLKVMMFVVLVEGKVLLYLHGDTAMVVDLVRTISMVSLYFDLPIVQFSSITALFAAEAFIIKTDDPYGGC